MLYNAEKDNDVQEDVSGHCVVRLSDPLCTHDMNTID